MSKVLRPKSAIGAFALVVTALAVFGASSAGAASGSLASVTNGVTVTYSGTTANDNVLLTVWPAGHTCALNDPAMQATYYMTSDGSAPSGMQLAASPATLTFGSAAFTLNGFATTTIAAGSYTFCLQTNVAGPGGQAIAAQLDAVIVDPNATTTTTSTSTTTTTAPSPTTTVASTSTTAGSGDSTGGDLLVPAFTG